MLAISIAFAQSPIHSVFKKYSGKTGVHITTDNIPVAKDTAIKAPLSCTVKTMTVRIDEEDKDAARLVKEIARRCNAILSQKVYALLSSDVDERSISKVYKYQRGTVTEICEFDQDEDELTLTVSQFEGLTKDMRENFQIKTDIKKVRG